VAILRQERARRDAGQDPSGVPVVFEGSMTVWSEIVALDPPRSLRLRFQLPGATGTLTYRISPGVERETCISQKQTFVVAGRLAGSRRWLIERMWKPRAAERLQDIRATLEFNKWEI
jgi:hypothetical protein